MTIASSAQQKPVVAPQRHLQWVDSQGIPTEHARQFNSQMHQFAGNITRIISVNCTNPSDNIFILTVPGQGPLVQQYNDYDFYVFQAPFTSTGTITGGVVNAQGTALAVLPWYKSNGLTAAGTGDIQNGGLYIAIFADYLNGGNGGFVIK